MLKVIFDFVTMVGMLCYLTGLITLLFHRRNQEEFFKRHIIIRNVYMTLVVIGFLRFVFAIPSLVN